MSLPPTLDPRRSRRPPFELVLALALAPLLLGCRDRLTPSQDPPALQESLSGDARMRMILQEIAASTPNDHPYLGSLKARTLRLNLEQMEAIAATGRTVNPYHIWKLHYDLGKAELNLGNNDAAVEHLRRAYELMKQVDFSKITSLALDQGEDLNAKYRNRTRFYLGVANMRVGEEENCCLLHNSNSCIVPIRGGGIHTKPRGSRAAIGYFTEVLENASSQVSDDEKLEVTEAARWLINIAHMTLDEYPDKVPPQYRAPPEFFETTVEFPKFENVMPKLGLETFNLCGSVVIDDFDGDEYLDIVTSTWDTTGEMHFFRNNQDGTFTDRTTAARLNGLPGGFNMVQADYDNDGDMDLFVVRGAWLADWGLHPNSLLANDGKGVFTDVTFEAGLGDEHYPTKTAAWADYDNDGDVDLYIGNDGTKSIYAPGQLFRNNGNGTFTDVAEQAGLRESQFAAGTVWGDYDGDSDPDLYVSTGFSNPSQALEGQANRLYQNRGDGTFVDVAASLGVTDPISSFPAWFWDYDNDGVLDLYVSCSSGPVGVLTTGIRFGHNCLYRGNGSGGFTEVSEAVNLTYPSQPMGANYGDLNNDGYLDFYLGTGNIQFSELTPNIMFLNRGGTNFVNVTMAGGFGHLQKGHGVSFADLDNDGDQDIYIQLGGAWPGDKYNDAVFENPGFGNHAITIKLQGTQSNRAAVGARIRATFREKGETRSVFRHVSSGGSFGANPLRQTIGIGSAEMIDELEIYWPTTGRTQTFSDVAVDRYVRIVEGTDAIIDVKLQKSDLAGN